MNTDTLKKLHTRRNNMSIGEYITREKAQEIMDRIDAVQEDMDFVRDAIRASGISDERINKNYASQMFALDARGDALHAYNCLQTVYRWLALLVPRGE